MSCPICHKTTQAKWRPFCSRRCADIDLGRWMTQTYRVPVEDDEVQSDTPSEYATGTAQSDKLN